MQYRVNELAEASRLSIDPIRFHQGRVLIPQPSRRLIAPVLIDGEERFTQADLEMARAGLSLLGAGLPMDELLSLAMDHASNVEALATRAIDLFDDHVRKAGGGDDVITRTFTDLLPQVTRLVALHFQRTVVLRALARLRASGDAGPLEEVVAEAQAAGMEIRWR